MKWEKTAGLSDYPEFHHLGYQIFGVKKKRGRTILFVERRKGGEKKEKRMNFVVMALIGLLGSLV